MDALPRGDYLGLRVPEVQMPQMPVPEQPTQPQTVKPYWNPTTKQYSINGQIIEEDDAASLLDAEQLLGTPAQAGKPGSGWFELPEPRFRAITDKIRNPSLTTRFTKNFGRGVDSAQLLAGAGLQFLGAERLGGSIVEQQIEDLRRSQPYEKQFTDIQNINDATGWFVGMVGQGLPSLIESAVAGIVGAGVGTATATPGLGTVGGGIAGLLGKGALKQQIIAAAKKRAAGEALDAAEQQALRRGGQLAGATLANALNSYRTGVSDIYAEGREQGAGPGDMGARGAAALGGIPYAVLDFASDALLAGRILGADKLRPRAMPGGAVANAAEVGRRAVIGGTVGGFTEGLTEMGQEAIVMLSTGQPLDPTRLTNAFAAGWAVGSAVGGGANVLSPGKPRNLMTGEEQELDGSPSLAGPQIAGLLPPPPAPGTDVATTPFPQLPAPEGVAGFLPGSDTIYGEAPQNLLRLTDQRPPVGTQAEMFPDADLGVAPQPVQPVGQPAQPAATGELQDVLPFESGLAPFRTEQRTAQAPEGALADNPVLRALRANLQQQEDQRTNPVLSAQRQAEFERAQAALAQPPAMSPRDRLLAQSRPFELAAQSALPEPEFGATSEMAASMWDQLRPSGRPKAFAKNLPGIQNQWIDALNMYLAGELDEDSLRQIRRELAQAESAARLTRSEPRTVVTGAITPAPSPEPTPPKSRRSSNLKKGKADAAPKPKAAALAKGKQAGGRSTTGSGDTTGAAQQPAGRSTARAAAETEQAPADVQDTTRTDDAAPQESAVQPTAEQLTPAEERGNLPTATARLDAAIEFVEEATTKTPGQDVQDAYYELLDVAFFDPTPSDDGKTRRAMQEKARKFLAETTSSWHRPHLTAAFRQQVSEAETLDAKKEWFQFMLDKDLSKAFPAKARSKVKNLDVEANPEAEQLVEKKPKRATVAPEPEPQPLPQSEGFGLLAALLQRIASLRQTRASWDSPANLQKMLADSTALIGYTPYSDDIGIAAVAEDLYAELTDADRSAMVNGRPVSSYFNENGELRLDVASTFEAGGQTFELLTLATDPAADTGRFSLTNMVPDRASPIGTVRLKVRQFVNKLVRKPKVHVFRDQADMKAKNPQLYREAVRARPEGDFDTAPAAGYSFGDGNVVIFSDRIANTQHLNFVMAHEVMGHFGLRGIIPADQFNSAMEAVYRASPAIQADVDAMVEVRGVSRAEATEEVLADMAGQLETSTVARVWNFIKGALNKLGVKFGDEFPRYFLSRARKYARTGKNGVVDPAQIFGDMYQMDYVGTPTSTGRFKLANDDLYDTNRFAAHAAHERAGWREMDLGDIGREFKGSGRNIQDFYDRFKSSFLSLANYRARDNYGMSKLVGVINEGIKLTSGIRVRSNERNAAILDADTKTKLRTSELLYAAQEKAATAFGDGAKFRRGPALFNYSGGKWVVNEIEVARLRDMGRVTLAQARDGFDYDLILPTGQVKKMRFKGIPGLTKDSPEWKGYLSIRDTIDEIALKLLQADYVASSEVQNSAFAEFAAYVDGPMTTADKEMFRKIVNRYVSLKNGDLSYDDDGNPVLSVNAAKRAEELLEFMNKSIISKGKKEDLDKFADILGEQMADDVVPQFRSFIQRAKVGGSTKFAIQDKIRQLGGTSAAARASDFGAKRTLATGYTPLHREGRFQIRTTVVDAQGKPMQVADAYQSQLVYMRVADEKDATETSRRLNEAFGGTQYEVEVFDPNLGEYVKRKGRLVAQAEVASDGVAGPMYLNYSEFIYGIEQLGIRITPEEMERAIKALTEQSSGVRKRGLNRDFVPGAEEDAIKAASIYIDRMASAIGKKVMRPQLSDMLNRNVASTRAMWNSDPVMPDGRTVRSVLKEQLKDPNLTDNERAATQRELDRLEYMYRKTNPEGRPARGNQYYNEAQRTVSLLDGNRDVMESDFEGGKIASQARAYTSLFQLGGSLATGILNLVTLFTNTMPYLMSYNAKNGFGGGFGVGEVVAQMHTAMMQVGVKGLSTQWNTAEFYDQIAGSKQLQELHGLAKHEAEFIAQEIRDGVFIPAQSNALLNTARGRTDSRLLRKIQDYWMTPFNLTEQASRRSAGLAAFRMEYARRREAGQSHNRAVEGAREFAIEAIELTMGEYSVHNRPPAFRTGWQTMLYMYKVYPVTTIQLFANLSRPGKLGMIAALWMLSGMSGLPFAEDIEDLLDTLMQGMGITEGSSRLVAARVIEDMFPGVSPYLLRGVVNSWMPIDVASRTSVGNLIPGTEVLLSGADVGRNLMDIMGPIPAAMLGTAQFAANLVRVPFSDQISLLDTARESPVTVMRAMGDATAYALTDRIIDRKGATISDELNAGVLAGRIFGFYPQAAAEQYSLIRMSQRVNNYRNETTAGFRSAWVKAKLAGDNAGARQIERAVKEWNRGAKGSGLEITDFRARSERALKEAKKTARERTLRATGKDARDEIERGMDLLSY